MPHEIDEPRDELGHRRHDVGDLGRDDGARHRFVGGFLGILHEHDAAGFLDGPRAERAVGAAAGKDHGEAVAVAFGERAEEHVDGRPPLARRR